MKYLTFIVTLISFLVSAAFLVIAFGIGAPNAHAEIRAQWHHIYGTEELGGVWALESDGSRLFAGASQGVFISLDNGDSWLSTNLNRAVDVIAISHDAVYASTAEWEHGLYRSDLHGNNWNPKNNGIRQRIAGWLTDNGEQVHLYPSVEQILVTHSGAVIAVGGVHGTYMSTNRGESWHEIFDEWVHRHTFGDWNFGRDIWTMTEFDGYLWARVSSNLLRSPDNGETWDQMPNAIPGIIAEYGDVHDWAVLDNRLYVGAWDGVGRWNEAELNWENLSEGLPLHTYKEAYHPAYREYLRDDFPVTNLAVNRGRLFAGLRRRGVWLFDDRSEMWIPAGLVGVDIRSLMSHQSDLFAGTKDGIYRASIPFVNPHGKAATTWGALKTK